MQRNHIINWILILSLILSLSSCTRPPVLSPEDTVKLYLDELAIFKDPIYRKTARDKLKEGSEEFKRYTKAVQTINGLIWVDKSSLLPDRRKSLIVTAGTIITYKDYNIIDERIENNKAFVTVVFEKTSLFGKDLGKASQQDSKPIEYELIKTRKGWQIKDIDGILAKRGF